MADGQANSVRTNAARYAAVIIGLLVALAAFTVWNINTGSVHISVPDIARIIFLRQGDSTQVGIVWNLRLPRICAAAVPLRAE